MFPDEQSSQICGQVFGNDLILGKIFHYLAGNVWDVHRAGLVDRSWQCQAKKILNKNVPCDQLRIASLILSPFWINFCLDRPEENDGVSLAEIVRKNLNMNGMTVLQGDSIAGYVARWTFLQHGDELKLIVLSGSGFQVHLPKRLENFFTENIKCAPSISFMMAKRETLDAVYNMDFDFPIIRMDMCSDFNYGLASRIEVGEKFEFYQEYQALRKFSCASDELHLNSFHLNRYFGDYKVIVSDWSDDDNNQPIDANDHYYPVKAVWFFTQHGQYSMNRVGHLARLIGHDAKISGGILSQDRSIDFYDPKTHRFKRNPPFLMIAFAGTAVESAIFQYTGSMLDDYSEALEQFKGTLEFNPDSDDLGSFTIGMYCYYADKPYFDCENEMSKIFAKVNFIKMTFSADPLSERRPHFVLHLVHFK
ncbi:uncharacterized protein LOC141855481 [Brevipalpus obovatus]|uniref:uncharacterized protein LOC141855481 n=1 Tax=Brevipalpus obovatus TaxID=246614 RepID=UPI003D9ED07C